MFTGIVEELGSIGGIEQLTDAVRLTVQGATLNGLTGGESVAVNGVCLTVADVHQSGFTADVMQETLRRTSLGALAANDRVNLERALLATARLGGHIMQGHVDGVATVVDIRPAEHWREVELQLPGELLRYVVVKGSIALDGVSLTVSSVEGDRVGVSLIPETLERTTLGVREIGQAVNVEVDVLAKYVERLLETKESQ
jgi:riboflavin synthase